jgi:hypothetical protein
MMSDTIETLERIRALLPLLRKITIRQVLDSGDEVISAAGISPWCVNEGRAEGHEPAISDWRYTEMREVLDREIAKTEFFEFAQKLKDELYGNG